MDGFTYVNIFETKGVEYLAIIAFLILLIPFWLFLNKKTKISGQISKVSGILSANILTIPQGLFYSRNHSWTHMEKSGSAKVGLDDLLVRLTGEVKIKYSVNPDQTVKRGELLAEIAQDGKFLKIHSPISGTLVHTNPILEESPEILNEDPYGKGWLCKIQPTNWIEETKSCFLAEDAITWSAKELVRFRDFLAGSVSRYSSEPSLVTLQDGGELSDQVLSGMPPEVWQDFQKEFLD